MRRIDKSDIGDLLKSLEHARHQLISEKDCNGLPVSGIAWIQGAISDAIIYIQLLEQELYQSNEMLGGTTLDLCEIKEFLEEVFGREDIAEFCNDEEKARLKKIIEENEWQDKEEEENGK